MRLAALFVSMCICLSVSLPPCSLSSFLPSQMYHLHQGMCCVTDAAANKKGTPYLVHPMVSSVLGPKATIWSWTQNSGK